jgi:hypothetical protein
MYAHGGCEKHINLPRFNPLKAPDIQIGKFRKSLLAHFFGVTLTAHIIAKLL